MLSSNYKNTGAPLHSRFYRLNESKVLQRNERFENILLYSLWVEQKTESQPSALVSKKLISLLQLAFT